MKSGRGHQQGPYKSALIAALPFLLRGAAIEERRNIKGYFIILRGSSIAAPRSRKIKSSGFVYCDVTCRLLRRRNRRRRNRRIKSSGFVYCSGLLRRPQLPAERLPKHRRNRRRTSQNLAAIRAL